MIDIKHLAVNRDSQISKGEFPFFKRGNLNHLGHGESIHTTTENLTLLGVDNQTSRCKKILTVVRSFLTELTSL